MGLETATYIDDLVAANPQGTDAKSQGDNHIRLIKNVLKNQFPSLGTEAVTATAAQLNDLFDSNRGVPTGLISMWSGTTANVPTGWAICDGTGGTPNLVDKFIVGSATDAGGTYDIGDTGGSATHTHTVDGGDHTHTVSRTGWGTIGAGIGTTTTVPAGTLVVGSGQTEIAETLESLRQSGSDKTTSSSTHSHGVTTESNIPPYYALAYIIKL